jgi:CRISPR/Cas system-associated exonuclease Cas4 (RecB family)
VAEPSANISVELEKSEEESSSSDTASNTDNTSSTNTANTSSNSNNSEQSTTQESSSTEESSSDVAEASGKYKVYIDAPTGVEAYLDGNYIGITPVSFNKTAGSFVVSLRKTGYQTRSYTLQIDSEEKDLNYTFTDLLPLE